MTTIYWQDEKPADVQEFISMHPLTAERKGVLLQYSNYYRDATLTVVLDDVCAENTVYLGAPFVGPQLPTEATA